jgi:hypothetical protein
MMPEFEVNAIAVDENHRAHAGAERDDQFDAVTGDAAEALHVGVVGDAHRAFQRAPELLLERKIVPSLAQVGRGIDDAVLGHPRKTHRDAIELAVARGQLADDSDYLARRGALRRRDARAIGQRAAALVEQLGLDARAADIEGKRARRFFL